MKAPVLFSTILFVFFAGCSSVPGPGGDDDGLSAASTVYGDKVINLNIPNRLSQLQIQQAILNAAIENRWLIVETGTVEEAGMVEMRRKTPFAETNFTFLFRPDLIEGFSNSFTLMSLASAPVDTHRRSGSTPSASPSARIWKSRWPGTERPE